MAIIKYATKKNVISVFEDPNPGKNTIYLEGEGYLKDSLAYKHNSHMFMTPGGSRIDYRGTNIHLKNEEILQAVPGQGSTQAAVPRSGLFPGSTMALTKDVGYAGQTTLGNDMSAATTAVDLLNMNSQTNLIVTNYLNMVEGLQRGVLSRVVSNDLSTISVMWYIDGSYGGPLTVIVWPAGGTPSEMYAVPPSVITSVVQMQPASYRNTVQSVYFGLPTEEHGSTGWVSELCIVSSGSQGAPAHRGGRGTDAQYGVSEFGTVIRPSFALRRINLRTGERAGPLQTFSGVAPIAPYVLFDEMTGQYVGRDKSDQPTYFFNDCRSDHVGFLVTHRAGELTNLANTTSETILSSAPAGSGIRYASGKRPVNTELGEFAKFSSKVFDNPTNSDVKHWFAPAFDTNLNYYPWLYVWTQTAGAQSIVRYAVEITLNNGNTASSTSTEGLSKNFGVSTFTGKAGPNFTGGISGRYRNRRTQTGTAPNIVISPNATLIKNTEGANNGLADVMYNEHHTTYEDIGTAVATGTSVTGVGTSFDTKLVNGDIIRIGSEVKTVVGNPGSATALTVNSAFTTPISIATKIEKLNRYLTMYTMSGVFNKYGTAGSSSQDGGRVVFTYKVSIDGTLTPPLPKKLTYHSSFAAPSTIKSVVFLKDDRTLVGMILQDRIAIYQWNDTDGWVTTTEIPGVFTSLGRDATDRIWATEAPADQGYVNIHSLSISIPVRIVLRTLQTNYDYDNTPINSQVFVSAYNFLNQRINNLAVSLSITGTSMKFVVGGVELQQTTVTTSNSGDTAQDIRVVSAGISEIIATINI